MALFKPYKITSDKLEDLAIQEGQIVITTDTKKLYVDVSATERIEITAEAEDVTLASLGVTATAEELNYVDGATSNIQTQLDNKADISHTHDLASTLAAGFLCQLSGSTSDYLRGDGTWAGVTATVADQLATARTFSLAGDVTGSATFDGSADCSITTTLAANSVTANEIASGAVGLTELASTVGTVVVSSTEPTDSHVKLWIKV